MNSRNVISVFLVDDHQIVRSGIKTELEKYSNIKIAGEAENGMEAIEKIEKNLPDVILMDIGMPGMNGLEATSIIIKKHPGAKIIALTMHDNQNYILEIIRLGALGYVMKDAHPEELVNAIESVYNSNQYYSSKISSTVLKQHAELIRKSKKTFMQEKLTARENEILTRIANGSSNKEIAKQLSLSVRTVETHREHIMQKLELKNLAGLIRYAISKKLVEIN
jgi:two-component system nitrate/nitrite response regulator NarL